MQRAAFTPPPSISSLQMRIFHNIWMRTHQPPLMTPLGSENRQWWDVPVSKAGLHGLQPVWTPVPASSCFSACLFKVELRPLRAVEGGEEAPFTTAAPVWIGQMYSRESSCFLFLRGLNWVKPSFFGWKHKIIKCQFLKKVKQSLYSVRGGSWPWLWRWWWGVCDRWRWRTPSSPASPEFPPGQRRLWPGGGVAESSGEEYLTAGPESPSWNGAPGSVGERKGGHLVPTGCQTHPKEENLYVLRTYNEPAMNAAAP